MPDSTDVVRRFARLRVPIGFAFGALTGWLAAPSPATIAAGAAVAALGEAMRIWAAGHLNKGREVTVSGPYRWLAHPLYRVRRERRPEEDRAQQVQHREHKDDCVR